MAASRAETSIENRRDPRHELADQVTIRFEAGAIVGPGQNISQQGVFFTALASIPVTVQIAGREPALRGELVRVETMGDGRVGLAVRFVEPSPQALGGADGR
ncbi:MAG: PilZ domain-containing protein [Planctomycetes bacterium]|nr:PilZ domain-containing protein [Planctomycetota bacterium]